MRRLEGKVLLVAGGGADGPPNKGEALAIGNGRAIAILGAREGARVMVTDRSLASAQETAAAIVAEGGQAQALEADVSSEAACQAAVAATVERFGALHLMVNNVGIVYPVDDFSLDTADYDRIMSVNLRGQFLMLKYAIPEIVKAGGGRDRTEFLDGRNPGRRRDYRAQQGGNKFDGPRRRRALRPGQGPMQRSDAGSDQFDAGAPHRRRGTRRRRLPAGPDGPPRHAVGGGLRDAVPALRGGVLHHRHRITGGRRLLCRRQPRPAPAFVAVMEG